MSDLFLAPLRKESGYSVDLGESEDAWTTRAYEELLRKHPWAGKFKSESSIHASTRDGFGVGFIHLAPSIVPSGVDSSQEVNVVTVPLLINSYRLQPLDLFFHQGKFFPLTEERVQRLLTLPDVFTSIRDKDVETLLRRQGGSRWGSSGSTGSFFDNRNSTVKFSEAEIKQRLLHDIRGGLQNREELAGAMRTLLGEVADTQDAKVAEVAETQPALRALLADSVQQSTAQALEHRTSLLKEAAAAAALEYRVNSHSLQARPWWVSSEETGRAEVGEWSPVPFAKVAKAHGQEFARALLEDKHRLVNLMPNLGVGEVMAEMEALKKSSSASEAEHGELLQLLRDSPDITDLGTVKTSAILSSRPSAPGGSGGERAAVYNSAEAFGLPKVFEATLLARPKGVSCLNGFIYEGTLYITPEFSPIGLSASFLGLSSAQEEMPTKVKLISDRMECPLDPSVSKLLVCRERRSYAVFPVRGKISVARDSGETEEFWETADRYGSGARIQVAPDSVTAMTVSEAGTGPQEVIVPHGEILSVYGVEDVSDVKKPETATETPIEFGLGKTSSTGDYVLLRSHGSLVSAELPAALPDSMRGAAAARMEDHEILPYLAMSGIGGDDATNLVKAAHQQGVIRMPVRVPDLNAGAHLLQDLAYLEKKADTAADVVLRGHDPGYMLQVAQHLGLGKSASILRPSIDAQLSLGFLSRKNLLQFVARMDDLQSCQSFLCSLLMAARLGLEEVPSNAVEAAVEALEPIIRGLRSVDYALSS